jgi:glucosamine 6-phosphate synthetase-like amidotransferase/phosphosugar isomerase protein
MPQMLIQHSRGAMSDASDNINNHPHVGEYASIIHEGWILDHRAIAAKLGLKLEGACDSELIMRIIDAADDVVTGIRNVQEHCISGGVATAVIDRREPSNLFLARCESGSSIYIYKSAEYQCAAFATRPAIFEKVDDFQKVAEVPRNGIMSLAKHGGDVEQVEDFAIDDF